MDRFDRPDTTLRRALWWGVFFWLLAMLFLAGIAMAGPVH